MSGWRNGSVVKSSDCSSRGPELKSQQPHGGSQPSLLVCVKSVNSVLLTNQSIYKNQPNHTVQVKFVQIKYSNTSTQRKYGNNLLAGSVIISVSLYILYLYRDKANHLNGTHGKCVNYTSKSCTEDILIDILLSPTSPMQKP